LISEEERVLLTEVQHLPLTPRPFAEIGKNMGKSEKEVITLCNKLIERGLIRNFSPSLAHRQLGFVANPMTAVKVPEERVDEVGRAIAAEPNVTHCYARSGWDYNIFFMLHGRAREEALGRVKSIMDKLQITNYQSYFSLRELKKVPFQLTDATTQKGNNVQEGTK
jgi:DNA-binding Lrp family transcriptional regulator